MRFRLMLGMVLGSVMIARAATAELAHAVERWPARNVHERATITARDSVKPLTIGAPVTDTTADRTAILQDSLSGLRWMNGGHRDWSRYTRPGQCVGAVEVVQRMTVTRTQWVHPPESADTVHAEAHDAGRACAAKFSPQTVRAQDLLDYQRLAVVLNDIPLITAIVDRRLVEAKTIDEKGSVLADAVQALDGRIPAQLTLGDSLIQRMQGLGPRAQWWEVVALRDLHLMKPAIAFDTARDVAANRRLVETFRTLSHDERMKAGLVPVALQPPAQQLQEYRRIPPTDTGVCQRQQAKLATEGIDADSIRGSNLQTLGELSDLMCPAIYRTVRQPVAPFTGGQWFRPGDTTAHGPLGYPLRGHVTLVVNAPLGTGRPTTQLAVYQRLSARYAKDGLDVILIHKRQGFAWESGDLSPATETRLIRWYDHDYLKLPFTIGVYDADATDAPAPIFIGRDGRVYATSVSDEDEAALEAFIRQALGLP